MKNSRINKEWHAKNSMPQNPPMEERINWHRTHAKHCACMPIPQKLLHDMHRKVPLKRPEARR